MANRTVKDAKSVKGTNPQYLIEKIIRSRIYDSKYWKEECFALTAELLVDKAMEIRYVGGVYGGNVKPTPFICLTLKMLQIQPEKDIIVEFIKNDDFKYVRALGAFYMRLTGTALDCFNYLEPLLNDNRKLRRMNRAGGFELLYMDDFIDELLREERSCDVILPRMQKREVLEEMNEIQPRVSVLEDDDDEEEEMEDANEEKASGRESRKREDKKEKERRKHSSSSEDERNERRRRERERERDRKDEKSKRDSSRERRRSRERRGREKERDDHEKLRERERKRERERERDREKDRHRNKYESR